MSNGKKERKKAREDRVELMKANPVVAFSCTCNKCLRCGGFDSKIINRPKITPIGDYGRDQRVKKEWIKKVYCPDCGEPRQNKEFKHIDGLRHRNWCLNKSTDVMRNEKMRLGLTLK